MDQEELFGLAEKYLSRFVTSFEKNNSFDYNSLQKFKNLIECIQTIEETQEYQLMVDEVESILYYGAHGGRNATRDRKKISTIVELFCMIKYETLTPHERSNSNVENVFLSVCAFAFTMMMFLP